MLYILLLYTYLHIHIHTHPFNGAFSGNTQVSRYQKGKTNLDFTEARDSEWQWHQLGCVQVCTSLETDNHASTPPLSFLQAGCPSCHTTNSIKAHIIYVICITYIIQVNLLYIKVITLWYIKSTWLIKNPPNTYIHLTALCLGLPGWAGTTKVQPIWISLKQENPLKH